LAISTITKSGFARNRIKVLAGSAEGRAYVAEYVAEQDDIVGLISSQHKNMPEIDGFRTGGYPLLLLLSRRQGQVPTLLPAKSDTAA